MIQYSICCKELQKQSSSSNSIEKKIGDKLKKMLLVKNYDQSIFGYQKTQFFWGEGQSTHH